MSVESTERVSSTIAAPIEEASGLPVNKRDRETERQIQAMLASPALENKVFHYSYDHRSYAIRIIHNPEGKTFSPANKNFFIGMPYALITAESLPQELSDHLAAAIKKQTGVKGGYIRGGSKEDFEVFADLKISEKLPFPNLANVKAPVIPIPQFQTKISLPVFSKIEPPRLQIPRFKSLAELQEEKADKQAEEQIRALFKSSEFANKMFKYIYENTEYNILVIHNPDKKPLDGAGLGELKRWSFVLTSSNALPTDVVSRLDKMAPRQGKEPADYLIDLWGPHRKHDPKQLADLHPVEIGLTASAFDEEIKKCFHSTEFVNRVFYYGIDGKEYKVRIIYNPEEARFQATRQMNSIWYKGPLTYTWTKKYGIILDKPAPQEFVDHLSGLTGAGWWDRLLSKIGVDNGGRLSYSDESATYTFDVSRCDVYAALKRI
jgi:hypothetical protein